MDFYNNLQQITTIYNKMLEIRETVVFPRKTGHKVFSNTISKMTLGMESKIFRAVLDIFMVFHPQRFFTTIYNILQQFTTDYNKPEAGRDKKSAGVKNFLKIIDNISA